MLGETDESVAVNVPWFKVRVFRRGYLNWWVDVWFGGKVIHYGSAFTRAGAWFRVARVCWQNQCQGYDVEELEAEDDAFRLA